MSDGEVQQQFKVAGYPSKYIISPERKLRNIPFGFDWQPFLNHLAQLKESKNKDEGSKHLTLFNNTF